MTAQQTRALGQVTKAAQALTEARHAVAEAQAKLERAITKAVDAGVASAEVARVAGVSKGRVSQIAPRAEAVPPRVHAQKDGAADSCVTEPDTVPTLPPAEVPALSGVVTGRRRNALPARRTVFLPGWTVATFADLDQLGGGDAERVLLTGPPPFDTSSGATQAEAVRAWALGPVPAGWSVESHYLADPLLPVLRFRHENGRRMTIMRAASWFGEGDYTAAEAAEAWAGLGRAFAAVPAFKGAELSDTPATAGRALWLRTIPEGKGYPVLSDELRELIAATSGQGRRELRPAAIWDRPGYGPEVAEVRDFTYLDGRFMYAALCWGLPVGEPRRWTGAEVDALDARSMMRALRGRGRWRITCTVPEGWAHVGLFMAPADGGGWCYPARPGQVFTTWADGCEVWTGMENGWEPVIHEGITWDEGKPLDTWKDALVSVWERANAANTPASRLAAKAVRSILLYAVGAFAARTHPVTRTAPIDSPPDVPRGTEVRRVGDALVWQEPGKLSAWSAETAHPEWSACVWARARNRLLVGRGVGQERTGALALDPSRVVAFATDALYVAGDPGWADDGRPGRFRSKGTRPGAFAWPSTYAELYRLRDEAENADQ